MSPTLCSSELAYPQKREGCAEFEYTMSLARPATDSAARRGAPAGTRVTAPVVMSIRISSRSSRSAGIARTPEGECWTFTGSSTPSASPMRTARKETIVNRTVAVRSLRMGDLSSGCRWVWEYVNTVQSSTTIERRNVPCDVVSRTKYMPGETRVPFSASRSHVRLYTPGSCAPRASERTRRPPARHGQRVRPRLRSADQPDVATRHARVGAGEPGQVQPVVLRPLRGSREPEREVAHPARGRAAVGGPAGRRTAVGIADASIGRFERGVRHRHHDGRSLVSRDCDQEQGRQHRGARPRPRGHLEPQPAGCRCVHLDLPIKGVGVQDRWVHQVRGRIDGLANWA